MNNLKINDKNRGWKNIVLFILPYILIVGIFELCGSYIVGVNLNDLEFDETSIQELIIEFFSLAGTFFVLWLFMRFVDKADFITLGFQTKNRFYDYYWNSNWFNNHGTRIYDFNLL